VNKIAIAFTRLKSNPYIDLACIIMTIKSENKPILQGLYIVAKEDNKSFEIVF